MRNIFTLAVLGLGVALAGCGGGGDDEDEQLIGPDQSYSKALEIGEEQWNDVVDIVDAEGWTPWADMPASGSATYEGVIAGWAADGTSVDAPATDYVADLSLEVDFGRNDVSGSVENFVTNGVPGFEHPEGKISLDGVIQPDIENDGMIVVDGTGTLEGSGVSASYLVEAEGYFAGDDAQGILGDHISEFFWLRGTATGITSWSDGQFSAIKED